MLIQVRRNGLRIITQHDHAVISGRLAHAWRGLGPEPVHLPFELVLATALHDFGWRAADRLPRLNPELGRPFDFVTYPLEDRIQLYTRAIDEVETVHPYVAFLVSLHYTTFMGTAEIETLQAVEAERRERLARALRLEEGDSRTIALHLRYLKLFDNLSLYLCLTPPSAEPGGRPSWLNPSMFETTPQGAFKVEWRGDDSLAFAPFPFDAPLRLHVPCRELDASVYPSAPVLEDGWRTAAAFQWTVTLEPRAPSSELRAGIPCDMASNQRYRPPHG